MLHRVPRTHFYLCPKKKLLRTIGYGPLFKGTYFSLIKLSKMKVPKAPLKLPQKHDLLHCPISLGCNDVRKLCRVIQSHLSQFQTCNICGYPHFHDQKCTIFLHEPKQSKWVPLKVVYIKDRCSRKLISQIWVHISGFVVPAAKMLPLPPKSRIWPEIRKYKMGLLNYFLDRF